MKNTRLYSVLFNKCPRCHKGNFFEVNQPYNLKKFSRMNECCSECSESFTRETGFYFGAMFASYALTVFFGIVLFLVMVLLLNMNVWYYLLTFSAGVVLLMPLIFRASRLVWINIFVGKKN